MWFSWVIDIGFPGPDRGEGWFTLLRLYSPLETFFTKERKAGEIDS